MMEEATFKYDFIKGILLNELETNKDIPKEDLIKIAEDIGVPAKQKEAKQKIISRIVQEGFYNRLYEAFHESIYVPIWSVADYYKMNSQQITDLVNIKVITEQPTQKEYYSRKNKGTFTASTFPLTVFNYDREVLQLAYKEAFAQSGYKIRIETETQEEVQQLVAELRKVFLVEYDPAIYERRGSGYNSYMTVKLLNNSEHETNRLLHKIQELERQMDDLKKQHRKELQKQKEMMIMLYK